ncbi:hypothetical protein K438DRAFT_1973195 [Mycena galopus ATCC 62051]|nr:hypothetical protein K438DRAFT_1973195 [Mycena galopus ATCC 62051]
MEDTKAEEIMPLASMKDGEPAESPSLSASAKLPPPVSTAPKAKPKITTAVIVPIWMAFSISVILYNNYLYHDLKFQYPVFLVTCHLIFATIGTRVLQRTTNLLDGTKDISMNKNMFLKSILPIALLFSGSLVLSNLAYLYISISYILVLKAFNPVAVLLISWAFRTAEPNRRLAFIVCIISFGVALTFSGEFHFQLIGFLIQAAAVVFEASRLVMIEILLHGMKMDPLVSLHYFAPVCVLVNLMILPFTEGMEPFRHLARLGPLVLVSNAFMGFLLNVAAVFLVGVGSGLILTFAGVLKDILLVAASVAIFSATLTPLQVLGASRFLFVFVFASFSSHPLPIRIPFIYLPGTAPGYSIALGGLIMYKFGFWNIARELDETEIAPDSTPPINARQGLGFECACGFLFVSHRPGWSARFWAQFTPKANGNGTDDAMLYADDAMSYADDDMSYADDAMLYADDAMLYTQSQNRAPTPQPIPMPMPGFGLMACQPPLDRPRVNGVGPPRFPNGIPYGIPQNNGQPPGPTAFAGAPPGMQPNGIMPGQPFMGPSFMGQPYPPNYGPPFQSPTMAYSPPNSGQQPQGPPQHGAPPMDQFGPPRGWMLPPGQGMDPRQMPYQGLAGRPPSRTPTPQSGGMQQNQGRQNNPSAPPNLMMNPNVNPGAINIVGFPLPAPSATENLFSREFIESVANGLDEFVDVGLFRGDGDLDFERDFGQWFNPDDVAMELGRQ